MSRTPSRWRDQNEIEKNDYLYDGNTSKQVRSIDRDSRGNRTFTFADGSTKTVGRLDDVEFDTWDED